MKTYRVYTFWAAGGRALYVGCTSDLARRFREHEATWPLVTDQTIYVSWETYPDWETGHRAEVERIAKLMPHHNVMHNMGKQWARHLQERVAGAAADASAVQRKRDSLRDLQQVAA